jgi:integrin beta 3
MGERGLPGDRGEKGEIGITGAQGEIGLPGPAGSDGLDGLGFEDLEAIYDGERSFTLRFHRGVKVKAFTFSLPIPIDRGVYLDGQAYAKGDAVTSGGSLFIAQREVKTGETPTDGQPKPGQAWRLAVKRGREGRAGKDGKDGPQGAKGEKGDAGRNYVG